MELKELREKLQGQGITLIQKKQYYGRQIFIIIDGVSLSSAIPASDYKAIKDKFS